MKTFEGQLFSESLKDMFSRVFIMFSGISRTATHIVITVKKNITGNKLYVLKLTYYKKLFLNLFQVCLEYSFQISGLAKFNL